MSSLFLEWIDQVFENEMILLADQAREHYGMMRFREGIQFCAHGMIGMRDLYREWCRVVGRPMNNRILMKYISNFTIMMSVACPHWSDYVWRKVLGNETNVAFATWPHQDSRHNVGLSHSLKFFKKFSHDLRHLIDTRKTAPTAALIEIAHFYSPLKVSVLNKLREEFEGGEFPGDLRQRLMDWCDGDDSLKREKGNVMGFSTLVVQSIEREGEDPEEAFQCELPFDQAEVLNENIPFFTSTMSLETITVAEWDPSTAAPTQGKKKKKKKGKNQDPEPGLPRIILS